jgi:predicted alpha/beta superfamily hydrolase
MNDYLNSMKNLIERSTSINRKKAILMGHGLGSVLINYFLGKMTQ